MVKEPASETGIYKNFPKVKTFLKVYLLGPQWWEQEELPRLQRYLREPGFKFTHSPEFAAHPHTYDFYCASQDLSNLSLVKKWFAIHAALGGKPDWFELWRQGVAYEHWARRMEIRLSQDCHHEILAGSRKQCTPTLFLAQIGTNIGACLALGWLDEATHLAAVTRTALERESREKYGVFNDAGDNFGKRRTQHFIMRLVADWKGWPQRDGPRCAYDEPIFNALIDRWRTTDLDELVPLLLAACDRHTHQSRIDAFSRNAFYDLGQWELWYDPFEVLAVLRLREALGLANPVLVHPLLATPLGTLPPVTPLSSDELLDAVLAQARREIAEF
jgi:hypothetical protein